MLDKGTILVYGRSTSGSVTLLQAETYLISVTANGTYYTSFYPFISVGNITLYASSDDYLELNASTAAFRYVLIPGIIPTGRQAQELKKMSYKDVVKLYHIPE
jgi:hypothetical protein